MSDTNDLRENAEKVLNLVQSMPDPLKIASNDYRAISVMQQLDKSDERMIKSGYRLAVRMPLVAGHEFYLFSTWIDRSVE